jgi:hypothetical protein
MEVPLVLLFVILLLFVLVAGLLLLLQQTCPVRDPVVDLLFVELPNVIFLNAKLSVFLASEVKQVKHIIELIMGVFHMFFETLKLKINFEPLLPADVAIRFLILFSFFSFLPKL